MLAASWQSGPWAYDLKPFQEWFHDKSSATTFIRSNVKTNAFRERTERADGRVSA